MNLSPLVSIIVAVKNETILLKQSVFDLLAQTYKNIEIIIVDDGSDADTKKIIRAFKDPRIKVITLPNSQGQSAARNLALAEARGAFIAIADADDRYHPERIELQADFMEIHPHIDVLGSDFKANENNKSWNIYYHHTEIFHQMLVNNPMVHSTVFFKAELLENGFHFRSSYSTDGDYAEDYDVFARFRNKWIFHNLNRILVEYTVKERNPETIKVQRVKARKIREHVLKEYIKDASVEDIELHHDFCELNPERSFFELNQWTNRIISTNHSHPENHKVLIKIINRQLWLYIGKCNTSCTKKEKLEVLKKCRFDLFYFYKNAVKLIIGRPL